MDNNSSIIAALDGEINKLDGELKKLQDARSILAGAPTPAVIRERVHRNVIALPVRRGPGRPPKAVVTGTSLVKPKKVRNISAAGRKAISAAQKARWAAKKGKLKVAA